MVKFQPSKLAMRVRFPLPAPPGVPQLTLNRPLLIITALLSAVCRCPADPAREAADPRPVLEILRAEIRQRPSRVLMAVEDALTMNERAACEIMKVAITSTHADVRLVGEIVFTALKHTPGMAASIVECAMNSAPDAVVEIKAAMHRALGEKAGAGSGELAEGSDKVPADEASGKETTGKVSAVPAPLADEVEEGFDLSRVGVGGIYLLTPSSSTLYPCNPGDPCCSEDLSSACLRP